MNLSEPQNSSMHSGRSAPSTGLDNHHGPQPLLVQESTLLLWPVHQMPFSQEGCSFVQKILNCFNYLSNYNLTLSEMDVKIEK